ncbi:protein kinase [Oscillochloris sp. ZM17-4]|uniref:protein kinase domain-containing protein n=1 Tax=Oscillochloris sp. ZM17-4 TaxID=2866714 RepID=UPI001C72C9EF|nr:protein kinase [Oscillochloris sp. ZM17-4]MBX0329892.1 protein kinase [Oscillochloris sp. ZM17-4]
MATDQNEWSPLQAGDRVSTEQRFEIIRDLKAKSGQSVLYLARLVQPRMLLSYQVLDQLLLLLGEPRWLLKYTRVFVLKVAKPGKEHNLARELRFLKQIKVDHLHLIRLYEHPAMPATASGVEQGVWPIRVAGVTNTSQTLHALALEYLAGGSLINLMKVYGGQLPPALAIEVALQVADGIQSLHDHGIIHQDLSPGNVVLRRQLSRVWPRRPEAVLIDLGVADTLEADERFGRSPYGKQIYLAPDRAEYPYLLHPPADVFSLGAVLYHMLAGRPDAHKTSSSKSTGWTRTDFPPLRQKVPHVPAELGDLVMSALDIDWQARPSLDNMRDRLRALPDVRLPGRALGPGRIIDRIAVATAIALALLVMVLAISQPWSHPGTDVFPTVTPLPVTTTTIHTTPTSLPLATSTAVR